MLFFVVLPWLQRDTPYFVRRCKRGMPADLALGGAAAGDVDWRASLLLNLALHTRYSLTVVVCSPEALPTAEETRRAPLPPAAQRVVLEAWPSTAKSSAVDLGAPDGKPERSECTYPDVCFEVSAFDSVFKAQVLEGENTCYSVVLHARVGEWLKSDEERKGKAASTRDNPSNSTIVDDERDAVVFSGYVTRDQLVSAGLVGRAPLLGGRPRAQRVLMTGPGGRGRAEVAVARVSRPLDQARPPPGVSLPRQGGLLRTLRQAAVELAGHGPSWTDFQCALISLELPISQLADAVLGALQ